MLGRETGPSSLGFPAAGAQVPPLLGRIRGAMPRVPGGQSPWARGSCSLIAVFFLLVSSCPVPVIVYDKAAGPADLPSQAVHFAVMKRVERARRLV